MIEQTGGQPTAFDTAMRFFQRLDLCQNSEERIAMQEQFARETGDLWEASVGHQVDAMKARAQLVWVLDRLRDVAHEIAAEDCPYTARPDQAVLAALRDGWAQGRSRALSLMQGAIAGIKHAVERSAAGEVTI